MLVLYNQTNKSAICSGLPTLGATASRQPSGVHLPSNQRSGHGRPMAQHPTYHVHLSSDMLAAPIGESAMIRRAHASDISRVAALYHAVWHETHAPLMPHAEIIHRSMGFFMERMTALLQSTLVTELNEEVVAFSAWRGQLLGQLFVAMSHRGTRVAPSLANRL
jgi:hypothetical protein